LLASDGSVCTLYRLFTVPWVRVVRSDVTAVAWENTAVLHFVYKESMEMLGIIDELQ